MVGGNDSTEKMIHREIPRVLVLRPLATTRCSEHCSGDLSLDNAFALIDGHTTLLDAAHTESVSSDRFYREPLAGAPGQRKLDRRVDWALSSRRKPAFG